MGSRDLFWQGGHLHKKRPANIELLSVLAQPRPCLKGWPYPTMACDHTSRNMMKHGEESRHRTAHESDIQVLVMAVPWISEAVGSWMFLVGNPPPMGPLPVRCFAQALHARLDRMQELLNQVGILMAYHGLVVPHPLRSIQNGTVSDDPTDWHSFFSGWEEVQYSTLCTSFGKTQISEQVFETVQANINAVVSCEAQKHTAEQLKWLRADYQAWPTRDEQSKPGCCWLSDHHCTWR